MRAFAVGRPWADGRANALPRRCGRLERASLCAGITSRERPAGAQTQVLRHRRFDPHGQGYRHRCRVESVDLIPQIARPRVEARVNDHALGVDR